MALVGQEPQYAPNVVWFTDLLLDPIDYCLTSTPTVDWGGAWRDVVEPSDAGLDVGFVVISPQ